MTPVKLTVVMANCDTPSPQCVETLESVTRIADRFKELAEVVTVSLDDPEIQQLGIALARR